MSDGPRYGGLISRLWGNGDQQLGNRISKKGAKTAPQKLTTFSKAKLNVDYGFAIKHDLTQRLKIEFD